MKKLIVLVSIFLGTFSYSQMQKIELTPEEINFISKPKVNSLAKISDENFNKIIAENNSIYMFEIIKDDKVLYRGTVNKWCPFIVTMSGELGRSSVGLCLKLSDIGLENSIIIIEKSYDWKIKKIAGNKYLCNSSYDIFNERDYKNIKLNHILDGVIETKIYKVVNE